MAHPSDVAEDWEIHDSWPAMREHMRVNHSPGERTHMDGWTETEGCTRN